MITNISDVRDEQQPAWTDLAVLAEQRVSAARRQGVELTGPGGLLKGLTKHVLETALDVELVDHLGHERGERSGSGNVGNGRSGKTVRTDVCEVRISVPRDRAGTFAPVVVPKHTRRLAGFDGAVLSLYTKGMTNGDIANHLAEIYGSEVSRDLVSRVTYAVIEDAAMAVPSAGRAALLPLPIVSDTLLAAHRTPVGHSRIPRRETDTSK